MRHHNHVTRETRGGREAHVIIALSISMLLNTASALAAAKVGSALGWPHGDLGGAVALAIPFTGISLGATIPLRTPLSEYMTPWRYAGNAVLSFLGMLLLYPVAMRILGI